MPHFHYSLTRTYKCTGGERLPFAPEPTCALAVNVVRIVALAALLHAPLLPSLPLVVVLLLPSSLPLSTSIVGVGHERLDYIPRGEGNYF